MRLKVDKRMLHVDVELFICPFQPKTLTDEVQRQQGSRAENKCVIEREKLGSGRSGSCGLDF